MQNIKRSPLLRVQINLLVFLLTQEQSALKTNKQLLLKYLLEI